MSRNEIIQKLFTGKNFNECIGKMEPAHLRDDLRQEVMLALLELTDDQFSRIQNIEYYTAGIICKMIRSSTSGFTKKYRSAHLELTEHVADESNISERELKEQLEDFTISEIGSLYWYDAEMVRLYMRIGTFRGIQNLTGIPHVSCFKTIKKAMAVLKRRAAVELATRPKPLFTKAELTQIKK
jgi:hypothetical protein